MTLTGAVDHYAASVADAKDYLTARGIDGRTAQAARLGVVTDPLPGHEAYRGRLVIPYLTASTAVGLRFRCLAAHDCKAADCAKYLSLPGSKTHMYNATAALSHGETIAITEGELDALILTHRVGIPAVGVPGSSHWQRHWRRVLDDYPHVLVLGDGDAAGRDFAKAVASKITRTRIVPMPEGMDVTDLFVAEGAEALIVLTGGYV